MPNRILSCSRLVAAAVFSVCCTLASAQSTYYVDASAQGDNDGTSWQDAFVDLQDALSAAVGGDQVWIAAGSYRPAPSDGDRAATFLVPDGIALLGGFSGGEASAGERDPGANPTVLSGDLNGDDQPGRINRGDNVYHIVTAAGAGQTTWIDGLTLTGGHADVRPDESGAGLHISGGGPTVTRCVFVDNFASSYGGAVLSDQASPEFHQCRFLGNIGAEGGGALRHQSGGTLHLVQCDFSANAADGDGLRAVRRGGALLNSESSAVLTNCTLAGNFAPDHGGGVFNLDGTVSLTNCLLWANRDAGGIDQTAQFDGTPPDINYCCLQRWTGSYGGEGNTGDPTIFVLAGGPDGVPGTIDDDLRLYPGSSAVDAGDNQAVATDTFDLDDDGDAGEPLPIDLGGAARFEDDPCTADTGLADPAYPALAIADMGAYEMQILPGGDVDTDGIPNCEDNCALHANPEQADCDGDGFGDVCTLATGTAGDCNTNGVPDACDIASGASDDEDRNGQPDECQRIFVNAAAAPGGDGRRWSTAFVHLQDALAVAQRGDSVWVAAGTYKPDVGGEQTPGDRFASFGLMNEVAIYGGFAGGETSLEQRDVDGNETVLSGDLSGDDVPGFANRSDNAYHVVTSLYNTPSAVLDGFTITGGNADHQFAPDRYAGGLYVETSAPTIRLCTFARNQADYGGALYVRDESEPVLISCSFLANRARGSGGAMADSESDPVLMNCVMVGNSADGFGGAVSTTLFSHTLMVNCTIVANRALRGGGISAARDAEIRFANSILWNNRDAAGSGESSQIAGGSPWFGRCCVEGWTGSLAGAASFGDDPRWVRTPYAGAGETWGDQDDDFGNLRLVCGSPCLDVGTNYPQVPLPAFDRDGETRILDGTVDVGAFEGPHQGLVLSERRIVVTEGEQAGIEVFLGCAPQEAVDLVVSLDQGDADMSVVEGATLTFTPSDFDRPQPVVLLAGEDEDRVEATARFRMEIAGIPHSALVADEKENDVGPVVFVNASAAGTGLGGTWQGAVTDLQEALGYALDAPKAVEELWVADGRYAPAPPDGDRDKSFELQSGLAIYGGFEGTETSLDERDLTDPETESILTGDLNDNDAGTNGTDDNSYHVIIGSATTGSAVLDGFTITGGYADGDDLDRHGAGMYNYLGSPTIRHCRFIGNRATYGGAIYNYIQSHPTILGCDFVANRAIWRGGAIRNYNECSPLMQDCRFFGNQAQRGGAVYNQWYSDAVMVNCAFSGNYASLRGGAVFNFSENPVLLNCTLAGNDAGLEGGGVYHHADGGTITNSILWANSDSNGTGESAQIHITDGEPVVTYCCIQNLDQLPGDGNIGGDPMLVRLPDADAEDWGDLRLRCGSVCLDSGTDQTEPPLPATDLAGGPRVIDGLVDLGALEGPTRAFNVSEEVILVPEGGTASFTVSLACPPDSPLEVFVGFDGGDSDVTILSGAVLAFDATNYSVPQPVTLQAAEDSDRLPGRTMFRIVGDQIPTQRIQAVEVENDISRVLYVDQNAAGGGVGTSWDGALTELTEALQIAAASPGTVDEIWVAAGTYYPTALFGQRGTSFELVDGVGVYGGFLGGETQRDQRDPDLFLHTILSGALTGNPDPTHNFANSYHVLTATGTGAGTILDGFRVEAGNADGEDEDEAGGGVLARRSQLGIRNCSFWWNHAMDGGAISAREGSSLTVESCRFIENASYIYGFGGAMHVLDSSASVRTCAFGNNFAWLGGGIMVESAAVEVEDSQFGKNETYFDGAGIYTLDGGSLIVRRTSFVENVAEWGGGISHSVDTLVVSECDFIENLADIGGGMIVFGGGTRVDRTRFLGNVSIGGGGWPAAGGAAYVVQNDARFVNTIFNGNQAEDEGGAILSECGTPRFVQCTFAHNSSEMGTGLACDSINDGCPSPNVQVANSILYDGGEEIHNDDGSVITVTYSDVYGGWEGDGNIDADPAFVDPAGADGVPGNADDDLRVAGTSPCIDAGRNAELPLGTFFDFDGNPRVLDDPLTPDTGDPGGGSAVVDLGAFEYQPLDTETVEAAWSMVRQGDAEWPLDMLANPVEPRLAGLAKLQLDVTGPVDTVLASVACSTHSYAGAISVFADGSSVKLLFDPPLPDADCCEISLAGQVRDTLVVQPLRGDVNRDGQVTLDDLALVPPQFGRSVEAASPELDVDGNGIVTTRDHAVIKTQLGRTAPLCSDGRADWQNPASGSNLVRTQQGRAE